LSNFERYIGVFYKCKIVYYFRYFEDCQSTPETVAQNTEVSENTLLLLVT